MTFLICTLQQPFIVFLEILPGVISWALITFPVWGSLLIPNGVIYVAYFILIFDVYWLYKSIRLAVTAVISHIKIKASEDVDWLSEVKKTTQLGKSSPYYFNPDL